MNVASYSISFTLETMYLAQAVFAQQEKALKSFCFATLNANPFVQLTPVATKPNPKPPARKPRAKPARRARVPSKPQVPDFATLAQTKD